MESIVTGKNLTILVIQPQQTLQLPRVEMRMYISQGSEQMAHSKD